MSEENDITALPDRAKLRLVVRENIRLHGVLEQLFVRRQILEDLEEDNKKLAMKNKELKRQNEELKRKINSVQNEAYQRGVKSREDVIRGKQNKINDLKRQLMGMANSNY